ALLDPWYAPCVQTGLSEWFQDCATHPPNFDMPDLEYAPAKPEDPRAPHAIRQNPECPVCHTGRTPLGDNPAACSHQSQTVPCPIPPEKSLLTEAQKSGIITVMCVCQHTDLMWSSISMKSNRPSFPCGDSRFIFRSLQYAKWVSSDGRT